MAISLKELEVKIGYAIGNGNYLPKSLGYYLENLWFKHVVYNFPVKIVNDDIYDITWLGTTFSLKIRKDGKYARDKYPFTQDPLGELIGPNLGYLKYYSPSVGDNIIDAGAYPGCLAIWLSKHIGDSGKIYCFEPDPSSYTWLKDNIELNKLTNVELSSLALGKDTDSKTITIDDFVKKKGITKLDFIKMDIEGWEIEALNGCKSVLKKYKPKIAIASYHIRNNEKTSVYVERLLTELGYSIKTNFPMHQTTYAW